MRYGTLTAFWLKNQVRIYILECLELRKKRKGKRKSEREQSTEKEIRGIYKTVACDVKHNRQVSLEMFENLEVKRTMSMHLYFFK